MNDRMTRILLIVGLCTASAPFPALAKPAPTAPRQCSVAGITYALDRESFAHNGAGETFPAPRLENFRQRVERQLNSLLIEACRAREVDGRKLGAVRKVVVFTASGETSPRLYSGRETPAGEVQLSWIFAEEKLGLPPTAELRAAISCWAHPTRRQCQLEED